MNQINSAKLDYTVLLGLDHFASFIHIFTSLRLGSTKHLRFIYFRRSSELIRIVETQRFDFAFMYISNITWDVRENDGSWQGAAGVLARIHTRHKQPVLVTQGMSLDAEYASTGVSFFSAPFLLTDLERYVPELQEAEAVESKTGKKIFSVAVVGNLSGMETYFLSTPLETILGPDYLVQVHCYQHVNDWEQAFDKPKLIVLYLNATLPGSQGEETTPEEALRQIRTKSQKPVLLLTNGYTYGLDRADHFITAGAAGLFSFLPPFPTAEFIAALDVCAKKSLALS